MDIESLGSKVKNFREKRRLSQEELGEIVGSRQSTISDIENGRRLPSVRMLFALSAALNVDLGEFSPKIHLPSNAEPDETLQPA